MAARAFAAMGRLRMRHGRARSLGTDGLRPLGCLGVRRLGMGCDGLLALGLLGRDSLLALRHGLLPRCSLLMRLGALG